MSDIEKIAPMFGQEDEPSEPFGAPVRSSSDIVSGFRDLIRDVNDMQEETSDMQKVLEGVEAEIEQLEVEAEGEESDTPIASSINEPLTEEDILDLVKKEIDSAIEYHGQFVDQFVSCNKSYHAVLEDKYNLEGRSTIVSSDVMDVIEWIMPSLMRLFTSAQDVVVISPLEGTDVESADLHQELINYQFMYKMDGFVKLYTWFKDALIYGTGVLKLGWDTSYVKKNFSMKEVSEEDFNKLLENENISIEGFDEYDRVEVSEMEEGSFETTPVKVYKNVKGFIKKLSYNGPIVENIPISSFFIESGARSIHEANFVAHRVQRTMDYLRRKQRDGIYKNVDSIIVSAEGDSTPPEMMADYTEIEAQTKGLIELEAQSDSPVGREQVWVWECWVRLDIDGDGLLETLLVTVANDVLLRVEENPFDFNEPPFEVLMPILDTHKFYGISLTQLVNEFQRMKTALLRNIFDNLAFSVNKWYVVRRDAGLDFNAMRNVVPGGMVMADDPNNGVREMTQDPFPASVFNILEYLDVMKENRTGVTRYNQGLDAASLNKTATGMSAIMTASQQRLELIARLFAETGLKNLFRKMISLNQQFIDKSFTFRLFNKAIVVTPDALDGSFDLLVNVGIGAGLRETQHNQMLQLLNILPSLAQLGLVEPIHVYNVIEKLLTSMGYKDIDSFIKKPQPGAMPQMPPAGGVKGVSPLGNQPQPGGISRTPTPQEM